MFFYNLLSGRTPAILSSEVHTRAQSITLEVTGSKLRDFLPTTWKTRSATRLLYFGTLHPGTILIIQHILCQVRKDVFIEQLDFNATSIPRQSKNVTDFKIY